MSGDGSRTGLRDVARLAGVSLATASRALAQPQQVSEAVRLRVEEVCRRIDYVPNHTARRLSVNRSRMMGLILPQISNPLFAPIVDGVRQVLDAQRYGMVIASAERDAAREMQQVRDFVAHGVDAVVTAMPNHLQETFDFVGRTKTPLVCISMADAAPPAPVVDCDNRAAMTEIVDHVHGLGHRRIAIVSGRRDSTPVIAARLDATLARLAELGLTPPPERVAESGYEVAAMRAAARAVLSAPGRPTAIIATGDQHAVSAILEAQLMGVDVPRELSVTGCNDVAIAQLCNPQLTTQRLPYREMGARACELALALLAGEPVPDRMLIPHGLVLRQSTAPLRGEAS